MSDLTAFYEKQISLTEWFEAIGHPHAAKLRQEDNDKRERLNTLNKVIGLPFDKPTQFSAKDVAERSDEFKKYLQQHGDELCAIRIMPIDPALTKLRMRGLSVTHATQWFDKQNVDSTKYRVDFIPHFKPAWSTIFIVNKNEVFGDMTEGWHYKLTQGTAEGSAPITFQYNFKNWRLSKNVPGAQKHLQHLLDLLLVKNKKKQTELQAELGATFSHDYIMGYFETTYNPQLGTMFIDYNRLLGNLTGDAAETSSEGALVAGRCGSPGKATGTVHIVKPADVARTTLKKGDILVCTMTTPDYVPLMQQASAIVTDLGGVLSHAAIVARELKKPCVTGTKNATSILKPGQQVTVDAGQGAVYTG